MMTKASTLLFVLVALSATNVLAAHSNFARQNNEPENHNMESGYRPMGNSNHDHPRLWDDRYCHMPHGHEHGNNHNGGNQHGGNEHCGAPPQHSQGGSHPTDPKIEVPMASSTPANTPAAATSTHPATSSPSPASSPAKSGDDTSGSFDGNSFDMSGGGDLDASHSSSSSTSSSSNTNDSLHIST